MRSSKRPSRASLSARDEGSGWIHNLMLVLRAGAIRCYTWNLWHVGSAAWVASLMSPMSRAALSARDEGTG